MSNTSHALINSSGNIPQEHCELAAQPLAHPGRRSALYLSTSLSCPLSPALCASQPGAKQLPPLTTENLNRLQGHNTTQTLLWGDHLCVRGCHSVPPRPHRSWQGRAVSYQGTSQQFLGTGRLWPSLVIGSHTLGLHCARAIPIMH